MYDQIGRILGGSNATPEAYASLLNGVDPQARMAYWLEIQDRTNNGNLVVAKTEAFVKLLTAVGDEARKAPRDALDVIKIEQDAQRIVESGATTRTLARLEGATLVGRAQTAAVVAEAQNEIDLRLQLRANELNERQRQLVLYQEEAKLFAQGSVAQRAATQTAKRIDMELRKEEVKLRKELRALRKTERRDSRRDLLDRIAESLTPGNRD